MIGLRRAVRGSSTCRRAICPDHTPDWIPPPALPAAHDFLSAVGPRQKSESLLPCSPEYAKPRARPMPDPQRPAGPPAPARHRESVRTPAHGWGGAPAAGGRRPGCPHPHAPRRRPSSAPPYWPDDPPPALEKSNAHPWPAGATQVRIQARCGKPPRGEIHPLPKFPPHTGPCGTEHDQGARRTSMTGVL